MKEIIVFVSVVFEGYVKLLIGRFVAQVLRGECLFFAKHLKRIIEVCKISGWKLVNLWLVAVESKSTHPTIFSTAGAAIIQPLI